VKQFKMKKLILAVSLAVAVTGSVSAVPPSQSAEKKAVPFTHEEIIRLAEAGLMPTVKPSTTPDGQDTAAPMTRIDNTLALCPNNGEGELLDIWKVVSSTNMYVTGQSCPVGYSANIEVGALSVDTMTTTLISQGHDLMGNIIVYDQPNLYFHLRIPWGYYLAHWYLYWSVGQQTWVMAGPY
jgi:hypothetical protein